MRGTLAIDLGSSTTVVAYQGPDTAAKLLALPPYSSSEPVVVPTQPTRRKLRELTDEERRTLDSKLSNVENDRLKSALQKLGAQVIARKTAK